MLQYKCQKIDAYPQEYIYTVYIYVDGYGGVFLEHGNHSILEK